MSTKTIDIKPEQVFLSNYRQYGNPQLDLNLFKEINQIEIKDYKWFAIKEFILNANKARRNQPYSLQTNGKYAVLFFTYYSYPCIYLKEYTPNFFNQIFKDLTQLGLIKSTLF